MTAFSNIVRRIITHYHNRLINIRNVWIIFFLFFYGLYALQDDPDGSQEWYSTFSITIRNCTYWLLIESNRGCVRTYFNSKGDDGIPGGGIYIFYIFLFFFFFISFLYFLLYIFLIFLPLRNLII